VFKKKLEDKGYVMETSLSNYTLRLAKKNGKPKTDMPCNSVFNIAIDLKQKFLEMKVHSCAIQLKNSSCIQSKVNKMMNMMGGSEKINAPSFSSIGMEIGQFDRKPEIIN
jgi:hypothetical protein